MVGRGPDSGSTDVNEEQSTAIRQRRWMKCQGG